MSKIYNIYEKINDKTGVDKTWYDSTNIKYSECIDTNGELKILKVVFSNGTQYQYNNVDVNQYLLFREDSSQGKALNRLIKGNNYEYQKLENANLEEINNELIERTTKNTINTQVTVIQETPWKRALNAARRTIGKEPLDKEPTNSWKAKVLLAEHSPIKLVEYLISFKNLRQWVGVHLLRHDFTLPFIHSQREDRRELNCTRDELPQGTPNDQDFVVNAQTLKNISRKRLCNCASKETKEAWQMVKDKINEIDPVMADKMVRNCVYCGFCPELKCCGFVNTKQYQEELEKYRKTNYND